MTKMPEFDLYKLGSRELTELRVLSELSQKVIDALDVNHDLAGDQDNIKVFQDLLKQNSGEKEEQKPVTPPPPPFDPKLFKPVDGKVPRSRQCCGNCSAYAKMPDPNQQWVCAAGPATPIMIGMGQTQTLIGGKPQQYPIVMGFWAPMDPALWCRQWQLKTE